MTNVSERLPRSALRRCLWQRYAPECSRPTALLLPLQQSRQSATTRQCNLVVQTVNGWMFAGVVAGAGRHARCGTKNTFHKPVVRRCRLTRLRGAAGPVGSSYKFRDATIEQAQKEIGLAREWLSRECALAVHLRGRSHVRRAHHACICTPATEAGQRPHPGRGRSSRCPSWQ